MPGRTRAPVLLTTSLTILILAGTHNPGKTRYEYLQQLAKEKAAKATAAEQAALKQAEKAARAALAAEKKKIAEDAALKAAQQAKAEAEAAALQAEAQAAIDHALLEKTPYLAQALKQIQKSKAAQGLPPTDILAQAKIKALTLEQSAHLSGFKATMIKGKTPSAKQQAVFDALPEEAQLSITADIDHKTGLTAIKQELADIEAGKATEHPVEKQVILKQWTDSGTAQHYDSPWQVARRPSCGRRRTGSQSGPATRCQS